MSFDPFHITRELKKIRMPTLLASGQKDPNAPEKYSQYLKNKIS
jgi:pimeloyl-ACP methyl ester carboxylesterase